MKIIDKIKLLNFKKFSNCEFNFNDGVNILIGDNGAGKTTILEAISIVIGGSISSIEKIGIHNIFNVNSINNYLKSDKTFEKLPELKIELFISNEYESSEINGIHHSDFDKKEKNGLSLSIFPDLNYTTEIIDILTRSTAFPFEYYKVEFRTFSGNSYNSMKKYKNFIRYDFIRNNIVSNSKYMSEYISQMYNNCVNEDDRKEINNMYRNTNKRFIEKTLKKKYVSSEMDFSINNESKNIFRDNLTLLQNGIDVFLLGKGEQLLINTKLKLKTSGEKPIILLEEPENHLSFNNMHKLINSINTSDNQMFISTHNNMIASRLGLNNIILFNDDNVISFNSLDDNTIKFF